MESEAPKTAEQNPSTHLDSEQNLDPNPKTQNNSNPIPETEQNNPIITEEESSNLKPDLEKNNNNPNPEQHPHSKPKPCSGNTQADGQGVKRKHGDEDPNWKTSLCSFYRRQAQDCRHGDNCRYAHGEHELRPRPDNSWDPTSEHAKKLLRLENGESELCTSEDPKELPDEVPSGGNGSAGGLSKCIVHLPKGWFAGNFKRLLDSLELPYTNAKKKKGATVGFITFSSAEHVKLATEKLNGHSIHNHHLKVADVLPTSWEKQQEKQSVEGATDDHHVDNSNVLNSKKTEIEVFSDGIPTECQASATDRLTVKLRSARDAVTPLAHMAYDEQLSFKKKSVLQSLKKLTRNARKACPSGVPLPEWFLSARNLGGLPCKFEGILNSPVVNGYRNKCEFTIGHSTDGKIVVGFLLGNFREGFTAVEEPTNCPNVSATACKYALIFQNFLRSSPLPVWNKHQNNGFWRLFTVREGRAPNQVSNPDNDQPDVAEVMLIVQVCSAGDKQDLRSSEFKRMAEEIVLSAVSASPPLPLTGLLVQDHLGISNAAPMDAPLFPVPLPIVVEGKILEDGFKEFEGIIHEYINNLCFRISPTAFFQVNTLAAERLYSLAGDWAALSSTTLLFDVCCGTGTIGLTLANRAGMVVGIEMNALAVVDAQRNAEINGIKNCRFVCAKAEDVMDSLLKEYLGMTVETECDSLVKISDKHDGTIKTDCAGQYEEEDSNSVLASEENVKADTAYMESEKLDKKSTISVETTHDTNDYSEIKDANAPKQFTDVVAIVDPPRSGLHPGVIKALRTHPRLKRLVYISCNPETLVANAIELCTPSSDISEKGKGNKGGYRHMGNFGLARQRAKSMPISEAFCPVKAMAVDLFPHTPHCEMVMLFER